MNGVISLFCTPEDANFRYKSYSKKALDDGFIYNYAQDNSHITRLSKKTELWLKTESGKWVRYEGQKLVKFFDQQYNCSDLPHYEASDVYLLYLINKYLKNANFIITRLKEKGLVSPSDEQIAIIKAALRGESLKVQAFAGTGKTTTIKMIAACLNMQSTYVVFNAAAKDSAKGNIENAFVTTAHGLAYKSTISTNIGLNNKFKNNQKTWFLSEIKKCFPKLLDTELGYITRTVKRFIKTADKKISIEHINKKDVSSIKLRCEPISKKAIRLVLSIAEKLKDFNGKHMIYQQKKIQEENGSKDVNTYINMHLYPNELSELIRDTILNYKKYSDADEITEEDFPNNKLYKKLVEDNEEQNFLTYENYMKAIVKSAQILWNEISSPNSKLPLDHDCYLKIWQLSKPKIDTPVIFIDESQDLDPVMLSVLTDQTAQKIWVGDRYQQIYAWRGAVNAMKQLDCCKQYLLTETYRFPQKISNIANKILSKLGEINTIKSKINANQKPANSKAFIARYNRTLLEEALNLARNSKQFYFKGFDRFRLYNNCKSIIELHNHQRPSMEIYAAFKTVSDLEAFLEEEQNDNIMRKALSFCTIANFELHMVKCKLDAIALYNDPNANLILITAHQSKGLEWDEIVLASDFECAILKEKNGTTEWNLLYVALTRTKQYIRTFSTLISFLLPKTEGESLHDIDEFSEKKQIADDDLSELFYEDRSRQLYKHFLTTNSTLPEIGYELHSKNGEILGVFRFNKRPLFIDFTC